MRGFFEVPRTDLEIQEAWEGNKVRYCAIAVVPADELLEASSQIETCWEEKGGSEKTDVEACIGKWEAGELSLRHRHAKRHRGHAKRHGHVIWHRGHAHSSLATAFKR